MLKKTVGKVGPHLTCMRFTVFMSVFHHPPPHAGIHLPPESSPAAMGQRRLAHSHTDFLSDEMFTHTEPKSYYRS